MSSSEDEKPQKSSSKKTSSKDQKKKKEEKLQSPDSNSKDEKDEKKSKPKQQKSSPRDDKDQKNDYAQKGDKKSDETQAKPKSKKIKSKDDDKEAKKASNDNDDDGSDQKNDKKSDKARTKSKSKKSKSDDDDETKQTADDSDKEESDNEYDDPGYEFQRTDYESEDSNNYSDEEYEEEIDEYSDYSDEPNEKPRNVHKIKRTQSHHIRKSSYKKAPLPSSSYRPSKPSKYTKCDSDLSTDPTTQRGRKSIAKKTLKIITYGPNMGKYSVRHRDGSVEHVNIGILISNSYKHSKTYPINYYKEDQKKPYKQINPHSHMCKFEVLPISTFEAAKNLVKKEHLKTCVLNYASATKPGGGFLHGRQAQEESLSRQSALYVTIKNSQMYEYNKDCNDDLYNDFMIYSSRVPVFRSSYHERLLSRREVFVTSVITSAAPNLHNINQYNDIIKALTLFWKQYEKKLKHRCRKILLLAIDKGTEAFVLGAYGCGVFENSPDKISEIYYRLLVEEGLGKYFVKIVFAIIDKKSQNFKAFYNRFNKVRP